MFKIFENEMETISQTAAPKFRCFISSESPKLSTIDIIPEPMFGWRKFGAISWLTKYIFNEGDLQICADVLNRVPYEHLKYLYGEIMYGGHIIDNRNRIANNAYLKTLIKPVLLNGCNLAKNYKSPEPSKFNYDEYMKYIIENKQIVGMYNSIHSETKLIGIAYALRKRISLSIW